MLLHNTYTSETEIARTNLRLTIDPFGLTPISNQKQIWEQARGVDSLFAKKNSREALLFYCRDCDSFIKCSNRQHNAYVRCMGIEGEHCAIC